MTKDINNLKEEELKKVNGGSGRNNTITIAVILPSTGMNTNEVTVYIDGQLESSLCNSYDACISLIYLKIVGSIGNKRVDVKVNDINYKSYDVNFDKETYIEI